MDRLMEVLGAIPTPVIVIFIIAAVIGLLKKALKTVVFLFIIGFAIITVGSWLGLL